jgi:radical SAM superfamily enzyme YgiQ (UPF0313 family)
MQEKQEHSQPAARIEAHDPIQRPIRILLTGPYDPNCGEFTFLAPPQGVWRLAGHMNRNGHTCKVFDPNNCKRSPHDEFEQLLREEDWDIVGFSTTGMTLRYDLELCSLAKAVRPGALFIGGGMEATFSPELVGRLAGLDLIILGEGEKPLLEAASRLQSGDPLMGIPSTAVPLRDGTVHKVHGYALAGDEFRDAVVGTPYQEMPYRDYWERLENAMQIGSLPDKAERETRLSEIRSVRIPTLNYCPMACTFCSSTNFLHEVQGKVAKVTRLEAEDCLNLIDIVLHSYPDVRTIIWQDDIFVFTNDSRIDPLCHGIIEGKKSGRFPSYLSFISTNRIDAMSDARLRLMHEAGFRVLGFGVESFSKKVLGEFNKDQIYRHIDPNLARALRYGLKPFLDLILTSPRSTADDLHETLTRAYHWIQRGCEVGLYPYIIPFSGSKMADDPELKPFTISEQITVPDTDISWLQPQKILPIDAECRDLICEIERRFEARLSSLTESAVSHMPSRTRSLIWLSVSLPMLESRGYDVPDVAVIDRAVARTTGVDETQKYSGATRQRDTASEVSQ